MALRDLSIGQRLALGFGAVLLLLVLSLGAYAYGQQRQAEVSYRLTNLIMPMANAANDIEKAYLLQSAAAQSYISSGDEQYLADYGEAAQLAADAVSRLDKLPKTPEGAALFAQIQPLAVQYNQSADRAIALRRQGSTAEAQQVIETEMVPVRDQLLDRTEEYVGLQFRRRDEAATELDRVRSETTEGTAGLGALALLCGLVVSYLTARSVSDPARALVRASQDLSGGDYRSAIAGAARIRGKSTEEPARDEMRQLGTAFEFAADALRRREERTAARAKLAAALASSLEVPVLAGKALREVCVFAGAEFGLVYVSDRDSGFLRRAASYSLDGDVPDTIRFGDGILGEAAASRRRVLVRDIPADAPFRVRFGFDQLPPRTVLAAPMTVQDQVVGVLMVGSLRELSEDSLEFLEISAQQVSVSIQNALAHREVQLLAEELQQKNELLAAQNEEIQAQNEELQSQSEEIQAQNEELQSQNEEIQAQSEELQSQNEEIQAQSEELAERNRELMRQTDRTAKLQAITARLSESLSPQEVLQQVAQAASDLLESSITSVLLLDESRTAFEVAADIGLDEKQRSTLRLAREESLAGEVIGEGRARFIEDVTQTPEVRFPTLAGGERVGSLIVAPLQVAGQALGVVEAYFTTPRAFSQEDLELLSALGSAAAVAVHNAELFDAVQQQRRLLESVLAELPEAVYVTDGQGRVMFSNAVAREMFGVRDSEIVPGMAEKDGAVPTESAPSVWRLTARALAGERVLGEQVSFRNSPTRVEGYAQASAVPISFAGRIDMVVHVAADISALKEVDRAKDDFLSMASHELKSPLTSVKGFAQLLQRQMLAGSNNQEAAEKMLRTMNEQADRVVRLVDRMLDLSRAQMKRLEMRRERVDLADLLRRQIQAAQVKTDKHRLVADLPDEMVGVWDREYLEEAVSNLLDNALRYSPGGGEVRVSLQGEKGTARLVVTDQGIGIPQEILPYIFHRHYRSPEARQVKVGGLGIGLYLTHEIVAAHGGQIRVESEHGKGSTFTVELPLDLP